MSIKVVEREVKFQNVNIEELEEKYQLFIDAGKERSFLLSRDDMEEAHIGLGDDLFYEFIQNMMVVTDEEGNEYYKAFLKDYEVPEPEEPEKDWVEKFKQNPLAFIKDRKYRYQSQMYSKRGQKPQYIIMSKKTFHLLQEVVYDYYRTVNSSGVQYNPHKQQIAGIEDWHFEGIPICLLQKDEHHFDIV